MFWSVPYARIHRICYLVLSSQMILFFPIPRKQGRNLVTAWPHVPVLQVIVVRVPIRRDFVRDQVYIMVNRYRIVV